MVFLVYRMPRIRPDARSTRKLWSNPHEHVNSEGLRKGPFEAELHVCAY